jgi:hypothetical protein
MGLASPIKLVLALPARAAAPIRTARNGKPVIPLGAINCLLGHRA